MASQEILKKQAAEATLERLPVGEIIGVGSGSTVNYFIDCLASIKSKIAGAVAASIATEQRLKKHGIPVCDLNTVDGLAVYVDSADEVNTHLQLIKGGGGALTREKVIAASAQRFICIVDESKKVSMLGKHPVAIEVLPMARSYVARKMVQLGGAPQYREGFVTDNGHVILDVYHLDLVEPVILEEKINSIAGVVASGIFAKRRADELVVATSVGVVVF